MNVRNNSTAVILLMAGALFLSSCNYTLSKQFQDNKDGNGKPQQFSSDDLISYEIVKKVSLNNCMTCHSGRKKPNLTLLNEVQKNKDTIWHEVDSQSMPPASSGVAPLTLCQRELLRKWIDLGAPEVSDIKMAEVRDCFSQDNPNEPPPSATPPVTPQPPAPPVTPQPPVPPVPQPPAPTPNPTPTPTPVPDPTPILQMPLNYETLNSRILVPKCLKCHSVDGKESDTPFYPYSKLMEIERLWKTPAVESKVYREITDPDDPMPPIKSKIPRLTDDEVEFVKRWIDAGKPN